MLNTGHLFSHFRILKHNQPIQIEITLSQSFFGTGNYTTFCRIATHNLCLKSLSHQSYKLLFLRSLSHHGDVSWKVSLSRPLLFNEPYLFKTHSFSMGSLPLFWFESCLSPYERNYFFDRHEIAGDLSAAFDFISIIHTLYLELQTSHPATR